MYFKENVIRAVIAAAFLFLHVLVQAQPTRVKGRVTDSDTGEGIPFTGIYFKNTTIGVTSDLDGYFTLETRDAQTTTLCATILGYDTAETEVKLGTYQEVSFKLHLTDNSINAIVVRPDNSRMMRMLAAIDERKKLNNPEKKPLYQCDLYTKMEIDLSNADEKIRNRLIRKNFGFIFNYMDTSVVSGQPYLPVMISETLSKRYHKDNPALDKEVITASQISGIDDESMVSQFTGNMHLKMNFYDNFINAFNVNIPSPIASSGSLYYNYYLIDSLQIAGRKTYNIRFYPKKMISTPAFDGEFNVDAEDFALQQVHAKLQKGANINWIRSLALDQTFVRTADSVWFYSQDNLFVDFSLTQSDSSKMVSFLGNKQVVYTDPEFRKPLRREIVEAGDNVMVQKGAEERDRAYWDEARPVKLSAKEENIYNMVDSIKTVPLYRDMYTMVSTFVNGFYDVGKLSLGPVYKFYSFNNLEGSRVQFGLRTSSAFSKKIRFYGYAAYSSKDDALKGGGSVEYMFSKQPTRKLTVGGRRDIVQLGKGANSFTESNIMSSLLSKQGSQKMSPVNEYSIAYDHEFNPNFNARAAVESRTIFSNRYVPMVTPKGDIINSVASNQAHLTLRFSWDETVTRGAFVKKYVYSRYPVITVDMIGAINGLSRKDYTYYRCETTVDYKLPLPPLGTSRFRFNAGTILGSVPYPLLKLHEGNGTFFLDKSSFACMDFYEFASDTWATLFYEHDFNGFFLGKIPVIRDFNLREVYTLKAAIGTLRGNNNGIIGNPHSADAIMLFPGTMSSLEKPYIEMGVGITNIFKVLRVDAFWRTSHRYSLVNGDKIKSPNCFVLNFGFDLEF